MNLPLVVMLALASTSPADDDDANFDAREERVQPRRERRARSNHTEVSFGYMGQWSDERNRSLELKPSAADPPYAGAVTDPFLTAPFSGSVLAGPVLEWRGIYQQVRLTVGLRFPFSNFRPSDTAQTMVLGGTSREVLVRSMSLWDFRTGIGFELPTRVLTPFVDVLGDVQTLSTQLSIDGVTANYVGRAFSLGGRLGLRYQAGHLFVALAAEATAVGPLRLGGSLQVGLGF